MGKSKPGFAGPGHVIDPKRIETGPTVEEVVAPHAAPAPGVPVSQERYEELKLKAKTAPLRRSKYSQEDPSG